MLRFGIIGAGLKAAEYARGWTAMPDVDIAALAEDRSGLSQALE